MQCAANSYSYGVECLACNAGMSSPAGSSKPEDCTFGSSDWVSVGIAVCLSVCLIANLILPTDACVAGFWLNGCEGCHQCPENTYSAAGASKCETCGENYYSPAGSSTAAACVYSK